MAPIEDGDAGGEDVGELLRPGVGEGWGDCGKVAFAFPKLSFYGDGTILGDELRKGARVASSSDEGTTLAEPGSPFESKESQGRCR